MSFLLALVAGLGALCFDQFLREAWGLDAWSPDFLVVLLLWLGSTRSWTQGAVAAAVLGLLADGFAASPLGVHVLHALFFFYFARAVANRVLFRGFLGRLLLGLAGGLASLFLLAVVSRLALPDSLLPARMGALVVPRVLVVVLAVPLAFPILDRLDALLVRRPDSDIL